MKLRFLGQTYSASQSRKLTTFSGYRACYRGQRYNISLPILKTQPNAEKSQPRLTIKKYRGVSYISVPLESAINIE